MRLAALLILLVAVWVWGGTLQNNPAHTVDTPPETVAKIAPPESPFTLMSPPTTTVSLDLFAAKGWLQIPLIAPPDISPPPPVVETVVEKKPPPPTVDNPPVAQKIIVKKTPPPKPPPPQPDYIYLGSLSKNNETTAFLESSQGDIRPLQKGQVLADTYRLTDILDETLIMEYLPGGEIISVRINQ